MLLTWPSRCVSGVSGEEELLLLLLDAEVLPEASSAGRRREAARAAGIAVRTEALMVDGSKDARTGGAEWKMWRSISVGC